MTHTPTPSEPVKLLPCPLCGPDGHPELHGSIARGGRYVRCEICGLTGPAKNPQREAIAAWNRRPAAPRSEDVVEAVARALFVREYGNPQNWGGWQTLMDEFRSMARAALSAITPPAQPDKLVIAREALEKARTTFQHYGELHAAKPDAIKAERNFQLQAEMEAALAVIGDA